MCVSQRSRRLHRLLFAVGVLAAAAVLFVWGQANHFGPATAQAKPATGDRTKESSSGAALFENGIDYPTSFRPYAPASPWNLHVSKSPTYASYSATVISNEFGSANRVPIWGVEAGQYDYAHPIFYASNSDPVVKAACSKYCWSRGPALAPPPKIRIPAAARPAEGADAHMTVIQPDGTEIDFWALCGTPGGRCSYPHNVPQTRNWHSGDTATAGNVANCGNFITGSGWMPGGPGSTASGACLAGGLVRPNELLAGHINHALALVLACGVGASVYPAQGNTQPDSICSSGIGVPFGARLWYDVPDATTNANGALARWEKALLNALHDYGGYAMDTVNGGSSNVGIQFIYESSEAGFDYSGNRSLFWQPLATQGWSGNTIGNIQPGVNATRWTGSAGWNPSGVNFAAHMHWLAPCSARGTC